MRFTWALALTLLGCGVTALADFKPMPEPVLPNGKPVTADIPHSLHIKNTGGSDGPRGPGSGSGLCVFTSLEMAARWQNVTSLNGFQKWMMYRPGGGWPEKVDQMIAQYAREKGIPTPLYAQHTGGDEEFLRLALKTDRMVCVTYAGRDDFYGSRIAHMTNLLELTDEYAAIYDNNRPGVTLVMSRQEFLARWRDMQGGWAVVLLDSPPPPYPTKPVQVFGQNCSGGRCGVPVQPSLMPFTVPVVPAVAAPLAGPTPVGTPPSDLHAWGQFADGSWGWKFKIKKDAAVKEEQVENFGVETGKIHNHATYSISGVPCTREEMRAAFGAGKLLTDDSDKWHLTVVGDETFRNSVRVHIEQQSSDVKNKLHVQYYPTDHWAVNRFSLPPGVSLRRPSPARISEQVAVVGVPEYNLERLLILLKWLSGDQKPTPAPTPTPNPSPDSPKPTPNTPLNPLWIVLGLLVLLWLVNSKKKGSL